MFIDSLVFFFASAYFFLIYESRENMINPEQTFVK